jgi:signal transduction histidine kinase
VFLFALLAGLLSTTVSATVGVTSLCLDGDAGWAQYGSIWWTWWLGDMMGDLVVAPPLVLWMQDPRIRWTRAQVSRAELWLVLAFLIGHMVFGPGSRSASEVFPSSSCSSSLVWMAFRFSPRKTATGALVLAGIALWGTLHGYGPFAHAEPNTALLMLQAFMGITAVTAMALAAAVLERRHRPGGAATERGVVPPGQKDGGRWQAFRRHRTRLSTNILTAILGFTELMLRETPESHPLRRYMEEVRSSGQRAAGLTRHSSPSAASRCCSRPSSPSTAS